MGVPQRVGRVASGHQHLGSGLPVGRAVSAHRRARRRQRRTARRSLREHFRSRCRSFRALHTVKQNAPEAYWLHFGRFGLRPVDWEISQGAKYGHFKRHGDILDTPEKKKRLRQFKWAYRFREALRDEAVSRWVLTEGFRRLERIREREVTLTVPVDGKEEPAEFEAQIGEIFRRDLSQALLLDWHINMPAYVWSNNIEVNQWKDDVQPLLKSWGVTSAEDLPVGATEHPDQRADRERQLAAALLQARMGEDEDDDRRMTDPAGRAIRILKYTETEEVRKLPSVDNRTDTVPDFFDRYLQLDQNSDYDSVNSWETIQSHKEKTLFFEKP